MTATEQTKKEIDRIGLALAQTVMNFLKSRMGERGAYRWLDAQVAADGALCGLFPALAVHHQDGQAHEKLDEARMEVVERFLSTAICFLARTAA